MSLKSILLSITFVVVFIHSKAQQNRNFHDSTRQEIAHSVSIYTSQGWSMDISGAHLFIGTKWSLEDTVYVHKKINNTWIPEDTIVVPNGNSYSPNGSSISAQGDLVLISANKGVAFLYKYDNGTKKWSKIQEFVASNTSLHHHFGAKVLIRGKYLFISSGVENSGLGYLHVYEYNNGIWEEKQILNSPNSGNGTFARTYDCNNTNLFVSQPEYSNTYKKVGIVYKYKLINNLWIVVDSLNNPTPADHEQFGKSLSVNQNYLVIGADNSSKYGQHKGKVSYYGLQGSKMEYLNDIHLPTTSNSRLFGYNVALADDQVLVYAHKPDVNYGDSRLFQLNGSTYNEIKKFQVPMISASDEPWLGFSFAFNGSDVCMGAPEFDYNSVINSGAVYSWHNDKLHAADEQSDGFISLDWVVPIKCAHAPNNPEIYFELFDNTNQVAIKIPNNYTDSINNYDVLRGSMRHEVEPDSTISYSINIYEVGSGAKVCPEWSNSGTTKPFQTPQISATINMIDQIELSLSSNSDHRSKYRLYRNNKLIGTLDTNVHSIIQKVDIRDSNAIVNGNAYTYSLESINAEHGNVSNRSSVSGATIPINFTSTNNLYPDRIELSWSNLASFADYFVIERDGKSLGAPTSDVTSFTDVYPIPGYNHTYTFKIFKNSALVTFQELEAGVDANGKISGYVLNKAGGFGVPNVRVILSASIEGVTHMDTTLTTNTGAYLFENVYYHRDATFEIVIGDKTINVSNNKQNVRLTLQNHVYRIDFETIIDAARDNAKPVTVSNLASKPLADQDEQQLNWNYTLSDQIFFKVYRNGELQDIFRLTSGNTTPWLDETGFPGKNYTYKVVAYNRWLKAGNWKFDTASISTNGTFPKLAPPRFLDVTSRPNWSTVHITWDVTSKHNQTVLILRDNKVIGSSDQPRFTDYTGKAGVTYKYSIRSIGSRYNENRLDSSTVVKDTTVTYPDLRLPTNILVQNNSDRLPKITWKFNEFTDYNFTGYKIVRYGPQIDTIATIASNVPKSFIDLTAMPGIKYDYKLLTYKGQIYSTSALTDPVSNSTPAMNVPINPGASDSIEGMIHIHWESHNIGRIDGFSVSRNGDTLWTDASSTGVLYVTSSTSTLQFRLNAFRIINGKKVFSASVTAEGSAKRDISGSMAKVSKLTASKNLHNSVKLQWDYPEYILATFLVTRNGATIATLTENEHVFYDYEVATLTKDEYVYGVYARYGTGKSPVTYVNGKVAPQQRIDGFVVNQYSKFSIDKADITLLVLDDNGNPDTDYQGIYRTNSDSTGYFSFTDFMLSSSAKYRIVASKTNSVFSPDTAQFEINPMQPFRSLTIYDGIKHLNQNKGNSISTPIFFAGSGLMDQQSVLLKWSMSGANFTNVEIYRGLNKLGTLNQGENMVFIDDEGAPGYQFIYRLRTIWEKDPITTIKSGYDTILVNYPLLKWVEYLAATKRNDHVRLNWIHEGSTNCSYIIVRNGDTIGILPKGSKLEFIDSTGQPDRGYVYSVFAQLKRNIGTFTSVPTNIEVVYPKISVIKNLSLFTDRNTVRLVWIKASSYANYYRVYRNGKIIATVPELGQSYLEYYDYNGYPFRKEEYAVSAIAVRNGFEYESRKTIQSQVFPAMEPITNFNVVPINDSNFVWINWGWSGKWLDSGYSSFHIYTVNVITNVRDTIANVDRSANYIFKHFTGAPENLYKYEIKVSGSRDGQYAESTVKYSNVIQFPKLSTPTNIRLNGEVNLLAMSAEESNVLNITWDYSSIEHSGFVILYGEDTLDRVLATKRSYKIIGINRGCGINEIRIQAFKRINGFTHYSDQSKVSIMPTDFSKGLFECTNPEGGNMGGQDMVICDSFAVYVNSRNINALVTVFRKYGEQWLFDSRIVAPESIISTDHVAIRVAVTNDHLTIALPRYKNSGVIFAYRRSQGKWDFIQKITEPSGVSVVNGFASIINMRGNRMVTSSPAKSPLVDAKGEVYIYIFNGTSWVLNTSHPGSANYAKLGYDLDINDDYCVALGDPGTTTYLEILKWDGSVYKPHYTQTFDSRGGYLSELHLNDQNLFVYRLGDDKIYVNQITSSGFSNIQIINDYDLLFKWGILAIDDNWLAASRIGASQIDFWPYDASSGQFRYNNATSWLNEAPSLDDQFGNKVAMHNGYAITAAHDQRINSTDRAGVGYSISLVNGSWKSAQVYDNLITEIHATKGTNGNNTLLTWTYSGDKNSNSGFSIYRDTLLIAYLSNAANKYFDYSGIPGKQYEYEIRPDDSATYRRRRAVDIGWNLADGQIRGTVSSQFGNSGIPGVSITAKAFVDGQFYVYNTTTDANGEYTIKNVYYGNEAIYVVEAKLEGHIFDKDRQTITLEPQLSRGQVSTFFDKTAFIINGFVAREFGCGLDSITLKMKVLRTNGTIVVKETQTNNKGKYSFVVEPLDPLNVSIEIALSDTQTDITSLDTSWHRFVPKHKRIFTDLSQIQLTNQLDFEDTLGYYVHLDVSNACDTIVGYNFDIEIKTKESSCYNRTVTTSKSGVTRVKLPPDEVYTFRVINASPLNATIRPITDYLSSRFKELDLSIANDGGLNIRTFNGDQDRLDVSIVYHNKPKVIAEGINKYQCNDPSKPILYVQRDYEAIQFRVFEVHDGQQCAVKEGELVIRNGGALEPNHVISYMDSLKGFGIYEFTVGNPMIISPYLKYLNADYLTKADGFMGKFQKEIIVLGSSAQPGSDFIIDLGEGGWQWPLHILRDPPGDGSYSYIEAGESFSRKITVSDENSGYLGFITENEFSIGETGLFGDVSIKPTYGSGRGATYDVSFETKTRIQTTDNSNTDNADGSGFMVGDEGDVIVGIGLTLKYGTSDHIYYDEATCKVEKLSSISVSPSDVKTTWVYTLSQIRRLIAEYKQNVVRAGLGTLDVNLNNEKMSPSDAANYYQKIVDNWVEVERYHLLNTVPFYQLCDPSQDKYVQQPFKGQLFEWRKNGFCNSIGKYDKSTGDFTLSQPISDISWTQDMIDNYNAVSQVVRDLTNKGYQIDRPQGMIFSQSVLNNIKIDKEYNSQYGADAERIAFSGGTTFEKTVGVSQTKSREFRQFWGVEVDAALGFTYGGELIVTTSAGVGAEVGTIRWAVELEGKIGAQFGYTHTYESTSENTIGKTNSTGYVLTDDDVGDQFNTFVFRGIDPAHTPYFTKPIGRSSCPYEPGTQPRDNPVISTADYVARGQDPNGVVVFPLSLSNEVSSEYIDTRYFEIGIAAGANSDGATLTADGVGQYYPYSIGIAPGETVRQQFTVARGPQAYDYPDLTLVLIPSCSESAYTNTGNGTSQNFEVYFKNPCSQLSLSEPGDNWVIKRGNPLDKDDRELVTIVMSDYDLDIPSLIQVDLQYRRIGSGQNDWKTIVTLSPDYLQAYYDSLNLTYPLPTFVYDWDITGNNTILDGGYELRARLECGASGVDVISNVFRGVINRKEVGLFGNPEPKDGLLSLGDEVSVQFSSLDFDCSTFTDTSYAFYNKANNARIEFEHQCSEAENKVIFKPIRPISELDGVEVLARVNEAYDIYGNGLKEPILWEFEISNNPIYWNLDSLVIDIYKGDKKSFQATLVNTFGASEAFTLSGLNWPWLEIPVESGNVPPYNIRDIKLNVDATSLVVKKPYRDTLYATFGAKPYSVLALPVIVNVYPTPVSWQVNKTNYETEAVVICNYAIDKLALPTSTVISDHLSKNKLDKIAVFINNELRGTANITQFGNNYRAYITVSGNYGESGKMDFYIWNAASGIQYKGHPRSLFTFEPDEQYGSTNKPIVLDVSSRSDSIRFIPLKKGWNWLAFNTTIQDNMSVASMLSSLKPRAGIVLKTLDRSSFFENGLGWVIMSNSSREIDLKKGYLLNLPAADTLKMTGTYWSTPPMELELVSGWNLIGNPYPYDVDINEAISGEGISDTALIKNDEQTGDYDSSSSTWSGISTLKVNKSYMIKNRKADKFLYRLNKAGSSCEDLNPAAFDRSHNILAVIQLNGIEQRNAFYKVRAFVNGECRGSGKLEYVSKTDRYMMNLFVYGETEGEFIQFVIEDDLGTVYQVPDSVAFETNRVMGRPLKPYIFSNLDDVLIVPNISNVLNGVQFAVYPNPSEGNATLKFSSKEECLSAVAIFDLNGKLIKTFNLKANIGVNEAPINLPDNAQSGIYILRLTTNGMSNTIRMAVFK